MNPIFQGEYTLRSAQALSATAYRFVIEAPEMARQARPGQFVHLSVPGFFLRRPISICEIDAAEGTLTIVFEVRGEGTAALASFAAGQKVDVMGPLGNGFSLLEKDQPVVLIGGGIGTPPMLGLSQYYGASATAISGFRNKDAVLLQDDFARFGSAAILCTDDGTAGQKGFVTDALRALTEEKTPAMIYACGPMPMLRAVANLAKEKGIRCEVSLEERMACGVGACLVCACKLAAEKGDVMGHVCKDGPVFPAERVIFE